ncbi:MAG: hypothetical protein ABJA02_14440 [Acidobacteriota bacterium]
MKDNEQAGDHEITELPDSWWYKVYGAAIATLVLVILALSAFSRYFSS